MRSQDAPRDAAGAPKMPEIVEVRVMFRTFAPTRPERGCALEDRSGPDAWTGLRRRRVSDASAGSEKENVGAVEVGLVHVLEQQLGAAVLDQEIVALAADRQILEALGPRGDADHVLAVAEVLHLVAPVLAADQEHVLAGAALQEVTVPLAAGQRVVAAAADQLVLAALALQRVGAAGADQLVPSAAAVEAVVAALALEVVVSALPLQGVVAVAADQPIAAAAALEDLRGLRRLDERDRHVFDVDVAETVGGADQRGVHAGEILGRDAVLVAQHVAVEGEHGFGVASGHDLERRGVAGIGIDGGKRADHRPDGADLHRIAGQHDVGRRDVARGSRRTVGLGVEVGEGVRAVAPVLPEEYEVAAGERSGFALPLNTVSEAVDDEGITLRLAGRRVIPSSS